MQDYKINLNTSYVNVNLTIDEGVLIRDKFKYILC